MERVLAENETVREFVRSDSVTCSDNLAALLQVIKSNYTLTNMITRLSYCVLFFFPLAGERFGQAHLRGRGNATESSQPKQIARSLDAAISGFVYRFRLRRVVGTRGNSVRS